MKKKSKPVREVTPPKPNIRQRLTRALELAETALGDCQQKNATLTHELALTKHELTVSEKNVGILLEFRRHLTANPKLVEQFFKAIAKSLVETRAIKPKKKK